MKAACGWRGLEVVELTKLLYQRKSKEWDGREGRHERGRFDAVHVTMMILLS